jgi:hypothetical protein
MNMPDGKPNLPKNYKEAESKLKQQPRIPKIPRKTLNEIFAGVRTLPFLDRIKEIGSSLNEQKTDKQPKMDTAKSDSAKAELELGQNSYDKLIQIERAKYNSLSDNPAHYDQTEAYKIDAEIENLENLKGDQAKLYNERIIPAKQEKEKEEFTSKHPLEVLITENQEYETGMAALQVEFKNAPTKEKKGVIGLLINETIEKHADKTKELKQMDANNKRQKIDSEKQEQEAKIAEQQRLDKSILAQFKKIYAHEKKVLSRAVNIKSIREKRTRDEKLITKAQKEVKKLTNKADNRIQNIENKELRNAEADKDLKHRAAYLGSKRVGDESKLDYDNRVSKDHVSIFQKLKKSVNTTSKKGFEFVKGKIKENDDYLTTERFDTETGERISSVIDFGSVIKNAEKAIESGVKKVIKETRKGRDKIVKSVESGLEDLINISNEENDRITSPEMILIKNKIDKDEQELDNLKRKYKTLKRLSKDTKMDNGDWSFNRIKEMNDLQPQISNLEKKVKIGYTLLEARVIKENKEYNKANPDKQVRIDNVNIATNQLNRLIKESNKLTLKTQKQAQELRSKKPVVRKDLEKLQKNYINKKKSLNLKIEELKKVIKDNK